MLKIPRRLQHFTVTTSTNGSPINCLPPEVITMIISYLCDFDALILALSSRHMFNMCEFRLQKMLDHRTSGGWIGKRLAAVGDKAYTPGFISYEPKIQGCNTGMVVPSRSSEANKILDVLFSRFKTRESATAKRIIEPGEDEDLGSQPEIRYERRKRLAGIIASERYPKSITEIVRFLLSGSIKVSGATAPGGKRSYVIRNLGRRHYIHASKGESFKRYLRKVASHKRSLEGTDCGRFTAEEAAICAFAMEIMWGGSRKEGEWAADSFDIMDEGKWDLARAKQEGWEDVSDDVVEGAIGAVQGVY
ncbi:hypothetical protein TWF730_007022 [Orbilia blumenaviensis]|uniref:F-box domain-containing protein n=1 Tax=Orbilia blumenaviensis TaxID=1796055 RepID=A0AAV9VJE7_9PEZI